MSYSSTISGDRQDEAERIRRLIDEAKPPDQWEHGSLGRSIWNTETNKYETWLCDPDTGLLELDLDGDPIRAAWEGFSEPPPSHSPGCPGCPECQTGDLSGLASYLADVERFYTTFVAFPSEHERVAVALWVAHAHLVERFETSPILAVTSAEMRSGKTRVLDVTELLVPNAHRMVMPSEAVFYSVAALRPRPTILLDEVDALFGPKPSDRTEGIRAVLNSGNRQGTPVARVKLVGKSRELELFDVYGAKAVAGIGSLPPTVADRSISIRMRRRAPDETVAKFRSRKAKAAAALIPFPDWGMVRLDMDPAVPDELGDRAADGWEPLLSIADAAGGVWPARARAAAVSLSSDEDGPASNGVRLLADIKDVFGTSDHLTTQTLLELLRELEGSPWGEWYGSPLTSRELAKLLGPYRIGPTQRRVKGEKSRGYFRADFTDAWLRYVPTAPEATGTSGTSGTEDGLPPPPEPEPEPSPAWRPCPAGCGLERHPLKNRDQARAVA